MADAAEGRDLRGADLRGADLRGEDSRDADLRGVRTGLPAAYALVFVLCALALSVGLGLLTGLAGAKVIEFMYSKDPLVYTLGLLLAAAIAESLIAMVWRGGRFTLNAVVAPLAGLGLLAALIAIATGLGRGAHVLAFGTMLVLVVVITLLATLARAAAGLFGPLAFLVVALAGAIAGKLSGGGLVAVAIAMAAMISGRRTLGQRPEFQWIARAATRLVTRHGTRLSGADLRGARLDDTTLRACDLRGTRLEGARLGHPATQHCLLDGEALLERRDGAQPLRSGPPSPRVG